VGTRRDLSNVHVSVILIEASLPLRSAAADDPTLVQRGEAPPLDWSMLIVSNRQEWSSPRFWSGRHAIFRASSSWAAKSLGVKFPSDECAIEIGQRLSSTPLKDYAGQKCENKQRRRKP